MRVRGLLNLNFPLFFLFLVDVVHGSADPFFAFGLALSALLPQTRVKKGTLQRTSAGEEGRAYQFTVGRASALPNCEPLSVHTLLTQHRFNRVAS